MAAALAVALAVALLATAAPPPPSSPPRVSAPDGPQFAPLPQGVPTQQYTATVDAIENSSASTVNLNLATTWTVSGAGSHASLSAGTLPVRLTWNGTLVLSIGGQLEFTAGNGIQGGFCVANVGTVWANVTAAPTVPGPLPVTYSWSTAAAAGGHTQPTGCPAYTVEIAPTWTIASPSNRTLSLSLAAIPYSGYSFGNTAPKGLVTAASAGTSGTNALVAGSPGTAGAMPFAWGWRWTLDPLQGSSFSNIPGARISWSSPYDVNSTYASVPVGPARTGTYTDVVGVSTISFQGSPLDPTGLYSFTLTYTIANTALPGVFATVNYSIASPVTHASGQLAATETVPYNLTWSMYEFTFTVPYSSVGYLSIKGSSGWVFETAFPPSFTYSSANNTVAWTPAPLAVQATFLGPSPGGSGLLTLAYAPSSPLFSFFGATVPFGSVETYVDGQFQPSATFPVVVGATYQVRTQDAFGHLLSAVNVTVNVSDQVTLVRIPIWPLSVVDLNSSYVVGLSLTANGVTQQAPDLAPLETQVLYLPEADYTATLDFLAFANGAIAKVVTVALNVSGVGFYVITGVTLTDIQVSETSATDLLEQVNVTFTDGNANLLKQSLSMSYNVSAIGSALPFRFQPGVPSLSGETYTIPIFLLNDTGSLANASELEQAWKGLKVDYVSPTGVQVLNWTLVSQGPGQFSISLALNSTETTAIENGSSLVSLTSPLRVGALVDVASGLIGAQTLDSIAPPGGWWNGIGIQTPPPSGCFCSVAGILDDAGWLFSSSAGRAIYLLGALSTILYLWEERELRMKRKARQKKKEASS